MKKKSSLTSKIRLPITVKEYDSLVKKVVTHFKLKDVHHAAAIISVAIRHLPPTQAFTTLDYLGQYVIKNLANYVANHKAQILQHESQVDQLTAILKTDPNDAQAMDELTKAANEGSTYARDALTKLTPTAQAG